MTDSNNTHLTHIAVQGFKSIKQLDLIMRPVNILIGANGAGKSNFISIFTFLRHLSEGRLQNYVEKQGFANTFFHFGAKRTPTIKFDLDVSHNGYHVEFGHGTNDDAMIFNQEHCTFNGYSKQFSIKGSQGESGLLPDGNAESKGVQEYTRNYLRQCKVYHFHDTSSSAGFKKAQPLVDNAFLYMDASNIAPFLKLLQNEAPENYRDIVDTIKAVTPFFHDFYLQPQGSEGNEIVLLRWLHRDHDTPFSANQLSDGTARFICLVTLFLQPDYLRPKTIIIDEPELGLHPVALDVLAEIIKSISQKNQVLCSTQSVAFANYFEPEDFIVVDQEQGASVFKRLKSDELNHWLDEYGMGDIWSKNLVGGRPEW